MKYVVFGTQEDGAPSRVPLDDLRYGIQEIGPPGRGKTRLGLSVCDQVAVQAPRVGQLVLDCKGDFFQLARRKWHGRGLAKRMVTIDPNQNDFVTGVNFTAPWPGEEERQAGIIADLFIRVAEVDPAVAVRMRRWTANTFTWLVRAGLTVADATLLLDYTDSRAREAVREQLPASPAKRDLQWICNQVALGQRTPTASKIVDDHLGSSAHRFRAYWENPRLRRMLGTCRAIDLAGLLANGRLVLVNLGREAISESDQRLLLLALLNESLRVMHGMGESPGLRVLITIDEAGLARGPELEELLVRGRSFGYGLQLLHQTCDQFRDPATRDPRVLEAVLSCCRTKAAFGGLSYDDATKMAQALWAHHLDPDRKQFVQESPRQLQRVVEAQSRSHGTSRAQTISLQTARSVGTSESDTQSSSRGSAHGYGFGHSNLAGAGSGLGSTVGASTSESLTSNPAVGNSTLTTGDTQGMSSLDSRFSAEGTSDTKTDAESVSEGSARSTSRTEAHTVSKGLALSTGTSEAITEGPMVAPTEVFYERSYQIEPLETQLARHQSALVRQPDRALTIAFDTGRPSSIRTLEVPDPKIRVAQARELDRRRIGAAPHYTLPAEVDAEIADRHAKLLGQASEAEVVEEDPMPNDEELRRLLADEMQARPVVKHTKPRNRRG